MSKLLSCGFIPYRFERQLIQNGRAYQALLTNRLGFAGIT
jgi:hypothetical protein